MSVSPPSASAPRLHHGRPRSYTEILQDLVALTFMSTSDSASATSSATRGSPTSHSDRKPGHPSRITLPSSSFSSSSDTEVGTPPADEMMGAEDTDDPRYTYYDSSPSSPSCSSTSSSPGSSRWSSSSRSSSIEAIKTPPSNSHILPLPPCSGLSTNSKLSHSSSEPQIAGVESPPTRKHSHAVPTPAAPRRERAASPPRGRSRWPRILWQSQIDVESLKVLHEYHRRAVGEELPVLKVGQEKAWSDKMEKAGL